MIKITATINIGENGGTLNTLTSSQSGINVSSTLNEVIGKHEQIQRPFILGRSRLGGGDCFTKKANFYIGRMASNRSGNFSSNYVIEVSGSNITLLTIVFNKRDNEFPRSITVDGETHYDDDPTWTIPLTSADTHTITISNWNKPNSPFVISSIYTDLSIELDDTNLLDFERTILDRSDIKRPSFGIISNTGSLSFIDKDGEVKDYIAQQLISSQNVISAYLVNTETNAREQIAYFNTEQWSYNNSQSLVNVSLKDDLEEWQDIKLTQEMIFYDKSMLDVYNYLVLKTPMKYSFASISDDIRMYLVGIGASIMIASGETLWGKWQEFCDVCGIFLYKNDIGKVTIGRGI